MHHRFDEERFLLVEPVEEGYRWFFTRELKRQDAIILVAVSDTEQTEQQAVAAADPTEATRQRARRGGVIVGYAYGTIESRNWNDLLDACGKLNDLYVDSSARRGGVGRALVSEMLSLLRARGAPRVVLHTAWKNAEAHPFFEALGFRRTMLEMTAELPPATAGAP